MKWIGQHIWDFTSRFRSTVYIENLETSLDNNVLVVNSDGKVTKNPLVAGDITSVTITTDSGGGSAATDVSGSADFSILGSSGVGVTNSGTTITAVSVPGEIDHDSLLNFVAAEHYDWSGDISGTATVHTNNITDLHGAGVDGSANQLLTDDGDGTVTSEATLTYNSPTLDISTSSQPEINLNMTGSGTVGGQLSFEQSKASGADGDKLGRINFVGRNDSGTDSGGSFAQISGLIADNTAGDEAGEIKLLLRTNSSEYQQGLTATGLGTGSRVDVALGYGTDSTTTIAGDLDIDGDKITTAGNIEIETGGSGNIVLDAAGTTTIESAGAATIGSDGLIKLVGDGVEIENASSTGSPALLIDNDDVDQIALSIDAANTTVDIINVTGNALSTGSFIDYTGIHTGSSLHNCIDLNITNTDTTTNSCTVLSIDYNKTGVLGASQSSAFKGIYIDYDDTATNNAAGIPIATGIDLSLTNSSDQGAVIHTGMYVTLVGSDGANTNGIIVRTPNGANDLKVVSQDGASDIFTIATSDDGETTLTTVENGGGSTAHMNLVADGNITMTPAVDVSMTPSGDVSMAPTGDISMVPAGGDIHITAQDIHIQSDQSGSKPLLELKATNTSSAQASELRLVKDAADTEDGENIGQITFYGEDEGNNNTLFGAIYSSISESDEGDECGKIQVVVANDGSVRNGLTMEGNKSTTEQVDVTIANTATSVTTIAGDLTVTSKATIPSRKYNLPVGSSDGDHTAGDIMYYDAGTASTTAGKIYYFNGSGSWTIANADAVADSTGMLAVALGSDPDVDGMLLRGIVTLYDINGTEDHGARLYLHTADGEASATAPGSGNVVRVIGYNLHNSNDSVYFNPDNSWVEVS